MFRSLFSCFHRNQNTDVRADYQRMRSSLMTNTDAQDIYGQGSIAIKNKEEGSKVYEPPQENEEIRIVAFGQIAEYFERAYIPEELPKRSRKVARIGLGASHAVFLFVGTEVAIWGKNDKGQLGIPIKAKAADNEYKDLRLIEHEQFGRNNKRVIDIAAGSNHTMFLVEPLRPDPEKEGEQREIFVWGDRNMLGQFSAEDSGEPLLVTIPRLEEDPTRKIKFIYASNEKCIVVDSDSGMTIWGRNFNGFIQREPQLFWVFKYNIKRIAVGIKHGLAIDENKKLFIWGDGTYGELGEDPETEDKIADTPSRLDYFEKNNIQVHSISAGHRHSIIIDTEGNMYSFGDNSKGQLASIEQRQYVPEKIDADFKALATFSGLSHNVVKTKDGRLYRWGGESKFRGGNTRGASLLNYMYELKGKRTSNIQCAQDNTIVISHLRVFKENV